MSSVLILNSVTFRGWQYRSLGDSVLSFLRASESFYRVRLGLGRGGVGFILWALCCFFC